MFQGIWLADLSIKIALVLLLEKLLFQKATFKFQKNLAHVCKNYKVPSYLQFL